MSKIPKLNKLLPFVAIGTIADAQSVLEPTNRLLIKSGIQILNQTKLYYGLENLINNLGYREKINQGFSLDSQDLAFTLSPILNASGRISHAKLSIQTLLNNNPEKQNLSIELIQTNTDRKAVVKDYTEQIDNLVLDQINSGSKFIWLTGEWNKGVVGLVASRIQNQTNLPVAVVSISDDESTGSFRAPNGYNLPDILNGCSELLIKFGGHPQAAGFTLKTINIESLKLSLAIAFENFDTKKLEKDPNQGRLIKLELFEVTTNLIKDLFLLDPFSIDFPSPILSIRAKEVLASTKKEMSGGKHFKININDIDYLFFNLDTKISSELEKAGNSEFSELQFSLGKNFWKGKLSFQLVFQKITNS